MKNLKEVKIKKYFLLFALFLMLSCFVMINTGCKETKYSVTFIVDGSIYETVTVKSSEELTMPEAPIKHGYNFDGWFFDNEFKINTFTNLTNKNIVVYAHFSPINMDDAINYTISFIVENSVYETISAKSDKEIDFPENPTKQGYNFDGWFFDNELKANTMLDLIETKNVKVYAKFSPKKYTISLNLNNGTCEIDEVAVIYDDTFELPTPSRIGFEFVGWYYNNLLIDSDKWIYNTNEISAKWEEIIIDEDGLDIVITSPIPADRLLKYPLYVNIGEINSDCHVFVKISCSNEDFLNYILTYENNFIEYNDVYYYHAQAGSERILFTNNILVSSNINDDFQNISEITLNFTYKICQSSNISAEDAYNLLFN